MSRSYRRSPVLKMCGRSNKDWRSFYNRRMRHHNKLLTQTGSLEPQRHHSWRLDHEFLVCPCCLDDGPQISWDDCSWMDQWEAGDVWDSNSDGWISFWDFDSERKKQKPWRSGPVWDERDRKMRYRLWRK